MFFRQEISLHDSINRESRPVDNHNQSTITGATCRCHISLRQQTEQILKRSRDHLHGEKTGNAGRLGKVLFEHRHGVVLFDEIEKAHRRAREEEQSLR